MIRAQCVQKQIFYIADYSTVRWQDDFVKNNSNHEQPGDPVKLSELIYKVSSAENPPLHLPVGADAVASAMGLAEKPRKMFRYGKIKQRVRVTTGKSNLYEKAGGDTIGRTGNPANGGTDTQNTAGIHTVLYKKNMV